MGSSFHAACDDCRCLVAIEPLTSEDEEALVGLRGAFGEAHVSLLEEALGAESDCARDVRRLVAVHEGHRLVLGSPEDMHGLDYTVGPEPVGDVDLVAGLQVSMAKEDKEEALKAVGMALNLPAAEVVGPLTALALEHEDAEVRQKAGVTLRNWRSHPDARAGFQRIVAALWERRGELDEGERRYLFEELMMVRTAENMDRARLLLPRLDPESGARWAPKLLAITKDPDLIAVFAELASDPKRGRAVLESLAGVLHTCPLPAEVVAKLIPAIKEHLNMGGTWHQGGLLQLLTFCGAEGTALLESFIDEPPPGVTEKLLEPVLEKVWSSG